jgi:hypothetical protein
MDHKVFLKQIPSQQKFTNYKRSTALRFETFGDWTRVNRDHGGTEPAVFNGYRFIDQDDADEGLGKMYCTGASICVVVLLFDRATGRHFLSHISAMSSSLGNKTEKIASKLIQFLKAVGGIETVDAYLFSQDFDSNLCAIDVVVSLFSACMEESEILTLAKKTHLIEGANGYQWDVYSSVRVNCGTFYVTMDQDTTRADSVL